MNNMKTVDRYVDEISGKEFKNEAEAIESEKKHGGVEKMFDFWTKEPKDKHCGFANGGWCYQRTREDFLKLQVSLVLAIQTYEPWIAGQYEEEGGLQTVHVGAGFLIGRYLSDGNSPLYSYYCTLSNICPKCFRQWGQQYYANKCTCDTESKNIK
jgi:hypothetical protein